jgi:hypothetical protein
MSMIFVLIEIKFDIDINNDEIYIGNHKGTWKEEKNLIITSSVQQYEAQLN